MLYNTETGAIELSVRELCARAHKSGSIDARFPHKNREALQKGSEIHRKLQAAEGSDYQTEVALRHTTVYNGVFYTVQGRADGVLEKDGVVTVDEIKTVRGKNGGLGIRADAFSQLRCYAYFLCEDKHLSRIRLRMRVFYTETEELKDTCTEMTASELRRFYGTLISRIEGFAQFERMRHEELIPSAADVRFPYVEPREGQAELAESCFKAIKKGKRVFAEAPTGIGKTMSTLYPAVRAVGKGLIDRIFYLTARASTRREAYAAAGRLFEKGAQLRTITLYAKEQMCLCEKGCRSGSTSHCNPVDCPYAKGYYDRVDNVLFELLARQNGFPRVTLEEMGRKHRVCPYELSLDLSLFCEIIICDYNYVFDPSAYLRRYFDAEEGERGQYVFLVDEAHNLPDRARGMYSAELKTNTLEATYGRVDPMADSELEAALGGFIMTFRRLERLCTENRTKNEDGTESGYYINRAPLEKFHAEADNLRHRLDGFVKKQPEHPLRGALEEISAELRRFVCISEYYDARFLTYLELQGGALSLRLICIDPAGVLHTCLGRARSAIFFSATLTPPDYFADILGGGKQAISLSLPSPYDPENLSVTAVTGISTRMEDREKSYKRIATMIAATVSAKKGNYLVYFPSYDYLEKVLERFQAKFPKVECVVQQRRMSFAERERFLSAFREDEGHLRVGFAVLGGSFSEGVDLPGSRLIGVVVVGVGIPGLSNERNILRDYYENKCERGYDYAYTYPGMNRVLQAAGRVIRRETDKGVVVLIDSRYGEEPYLHLYPPHWQNIAAAGDARSLAHRLTAFWQGHEGK